MIVAGSSHIQIQFSRERLLRQVKDAVPHLCDKSIVRSVSIRIELQCEYPDRDSDDRSPHCTQMHYIKHEIERTLKEHVPVESYVVVDGKLIPVPDAAIELSKSLGKLTKMI